MIVLLSVFLVGVLVYSTIKRNLQILRAAAEDCLMVIGVIFVNALFFGTLWGLWYLIEKVFGWVLIARILVVVLCIILLVLLYYLIKRIVEELIQKYRPRMFVANSHTPEVWKEVIRRASPRDQTSILRRTNHQALGLNAAEFLKVLQEIAPHIRYEPALSTYWAQRDQLEQVLKQERLGPGQE